MEAAPNAYPQVLLTGPGARAEVPTWLRYTPRVATAGEIRLLISEEATADSDSAPPPTLEKS
jgi:hypothetical protein